MKSFEINCPTTYLSCDKLDVFPVYLFGSIEYHISNNGQPLSVLKQTSAGEWSIKSGKPVSTDELAFLTKEIETALY